MALETLAATMLETKLIDAARRALVDDLYNEVSQIAPNAFEIASATDNEVAYFVVFKGRGLMPNVDYRCSCRAGRRGLVCKHAAVALYRMRRVDEAGIPNVRP